jgi:hypothetical protein
MPDKIVPLRPKYYAVVRRPDYVDFGQKVAHGR